MSQNRDYFGEQMALLPLSTLLAIIFVIYFVGKSCKDGQCSIDVDMNAKFENYLLENVIADIKQEKSISKKCSDNEILAAITRIASDSTKKYNPDAIFSEKSIDVPKERCACAKRAKELIDKLAKNICNNDIDLDGQERKGDSQTYPPGLCGNVDIVHPNTGRVADDTEALQGGLVAVYRNYGTPVTRLILRRVGNGQTGSTYTLKFKSENMNIWRDSIKSHRVISGVTEFGTESDTTLYLEGRRHSSSVGEILVTAMLKNNVHGKPKNTEVDSVRLTVVEAEFDVYLKAWIRDQWFHLGPCLNYPANPVLTDKIMGGDDRGASLSPTVSYRVFQKATLTPFEDLHASRVLPLGSDSNLAGVSKIYKKSQSVDKSTGRLKHGAKPEKAAKADISRVTIEIVKTNQKNVSQVRFHGAANNPLITWSPDIDWQFDVTIDASDIANPLYKIDGGHDLFPSFEIDIEQSGQKRAELFSYLHSFPSAVCVLALLGDKTKTIPTQQGSIWGLNWK